MNPLSSTDLASQKILIAEPFAKFLSATDEEVDFELSLLDVVRFSGHACISVTGAFLSAQAAIRELFPETNRCVRGEIEIYMRGSVDQGATAAIANVLGFITGAWASIGFGGLKGQFVRRGLLHFNADLPAGVIRFHRLSTNQTVDVYCDPSVTAAEDGSGEPFQLKWRKQIQKMLERADDVIRVVHRSGNERTSITA